MSTSGSAIRIDEPAQGSPLLRRLDWSQRQEARESLRTSPLLFLHLPDAEPEDLIGFAQCLGAPCPIKRKNVAVGDSGMVMAIGNELDRSRKRISSSARSLGFHSDMSWDSAASAFTLLYAVRVPDHGGDTEFISLYRIYEQLDTIRREQWMSAEVDHLNKTKFFENKPLEERSCRQPLIQRHPDSNRSMVFASPGYMEQILGLSESERTDAHNWLDRALRAPDYVHEWRVGDLLVWDNRAVVHRATEFPDDERRCMWRLSISANT